MRHARADDYLRTGGPWDVPSLDLALSRTTTTAVDDARSLAPGPLDEAVSATAAWLAAHGGGPGAVVSWQLPNSVEAYLLYRACWRLGAVAAPVHHAAGGADVDAALDQVSPDLVIAAPERAALARPGAVELTPGDRSWPPPGRAAVDAPPDRADPAVVLFTSGSSGRPKAVLHTHRGLVTKARTMVEVHGLDPSDVVLMPAPLAHISGLLNGVLLPTTAGMTTVLMAKWDPVAALELIERHGVTFMIGPPTFFVSLMGAAGFSTDRVASLRLVSSGGSGVTPAFVQSAAASLGCRVKRTYGSTEAPTVTTSCAGDPEDRARETDGRPTRDVEVRISDPASGAEMPTGDVGEVRLRGPELFEGYLDPALTAEAFTTDGWFRTGDLGTVDGAGWLTITGRIKDVIIRGGENISAAEVEGVLEAHPAVSQAVAVGYPDERLGHRVCAFVVAAGPFDLSRSCEWMQERGVTRFKWPERLVQVDALPLLASGKVDRAGLERRAASG